MRYKKGSSVGSGEYVADAKKKVIVASPRREKPRR